MKKNEIARALKSALRTTEALDALRRENPELEGAYQSARHAMRVLLGVRDDIEIARRERKAKPDEWYTASEWYEYSHDFN